MNEPSPTCPRCFETRRPGITAVVMNRKETLLAFRNVPAMVCRCGEDEAFPVAMENVWRMAMDVTIPRDVTQIVMDYASPRK